MEDKLSSQLMDFAVMIIQLVKQPKSAHESIPEPDRSLGNKHQHCEYLRSAYAFEQILYQSSKPAQRSERNRY